jgi:hypothetical protein
VPESAAAGANQQHLDYYYIQSLIMRMLTALLGNRRTGMPWCPQAFAASSAQDIDQAGGSSKEMQPRWHSAAVVGHISQRYSHSLAVESERSVAMRRFWRLPLGCFHRRMASSSQQLPELVEACALAVRRS